MNSLPKKMMKLLQLEMIFHISMVLFILKKVIVVPNGFLKVSNIASKPKITKICLKLSETYTLKVSQSIMNNRKNLRMPQMLLRNLSRRRNFKLLKQLRKLKQRQRRREKDKMMIQWKMTAQLKWTNLTRKKFTTCSCHPASKEHLKIKYLDHLYSVQLSLII